MKDLSDYRRSYEKSELDEKTVSENPLDLFNKWFHDAEAASSADEVNAMTLSTIGLDGFPKSRIVLLKRFDHDGFTFFTNYRSDKGKAIAANPNVCLSFFWGATERQVVIKGIASKTPGDVSDEYFATRPLGSQLGALASDQSAVISSRKALEEELAKLESQYSGKSVSRPDNWGGYIVSPIEIEFWQGRANRLHDRIRYRLDGHWTIERLAP